LRGRGWGRCVRQPGHRQGTGRTGERPGPGQRLPGRTEQIDGCDRMRGEEEAARGIERYGDMVRRLCLVHLKNPADTEDIFQNVFLKYVLSPVVFESPEHEKAWLIRVTLNACKDLVKSFFRSRTVPLEELLDQPAPL